SRGGESALDVVEVQPEWFALPARFLLQQAYELVGGDGLLGFHDQVRLARHGYSAGFATAVAVRTRELRERRASEQEPLEQPFVHDGYAPGLHAFVVVLVVPHQL